MSHLLSGIAVVIFSRCKQSESRVVSNAERRVYEFWVRYVLMQSSFYLNNVMTAVLPFLTFAEQLPDSQPQCLHQCSSCQTRPIVCVPIARGGEDIIPFLCLSFCSGFSSFCCVCFWCLASRLFLLSGSSQSGQTFDPCSAIVRLDSVVKWEISFTFKTSYNLCLFTCSLLACEISRD